MHIGKLCLPSSHLSNHAEKDFCVAEVLEWKSYRSMESTIQYTNESIDRVKTFEAFVTRRAQIEEEYAASLSKKKRLKINVFLHLFTLFLRRRKVVHGGELAALGQPFPE